MPQGKQTSFSYGEVSPSLQYKSNQVSYAEGLAQLTNGFIKADGGWSNRSGFKFLVELENDTSDLGLKQGNQKSRLFSYRTIADTFLSPSEGRTRIMRYKNPTWVENTTSAGSVDIINRQGTVSAVLVGGATGYPSGERSVGGDPRLAQLTEIGSSKMLTFGEVNNTIRNYLYNMEEADSLFGPTQIPYILVFGVNLALGAITYYWYGLEPATINKIPASYLFMVEYNDGTEIFAQRVDLPEGHPHANLSSRIQSTTITIPDNIKSINVYRSAGSESSAFALVGRIPILDPAMTSLDFRDYVIVGDITNGPPINPRLWGTQYGASAASVYTDTFALRAVRRTMSYQQRLFIAYDSFESNGLYEGTIGVSRLGAPKMLHSPDIYNSVDAFDFKIAVSPGSKIIHMIPMDRGFVFTTDQIFILQGSGEQGFITATEVNPVEISNEGASRYITPVALSDSIIFVTKDHKRIFMIATRGSEYKISRIGLESDHLLNQDIVEMEVTRGRDTIVWILRRDGKLVSITMGEVPGFALHETDGLITSISKMEHNPEFNTEGYFDDTYTPDLMDFNKADEECLVVQVLRDVNGQRNLNLEILTPRLDEDNKEEGFSYMDSYTHIGARLTLTQSGKYLAYNTNDLPTQERVPLNIQDGTDYTAGDPVNLRAATDETLTIGAKTYIDFYYDEDIEDVDTGEPITIKRTIRFTKTGTATWDATDFLMPGYFDQDVPITLIDAETQALDNMLALQTRYCAPQKDLTGLTHLAGKEVSVFADNRVISSPNSPDPDMQTLTVNASGELDLGDYYGYITVGLPYTTTMQSLNIETSGDRTLTDANKQLNEIGIAFENTRQGYVSHSGAKLDITKFEKLRYRTDEAFDSPDRNFSGYLPVPIQSSWDPRGRTVIKQVDPLPISVLSIYPKGVSSGE